MSRAYVRIPLGLALAAGISMFALQAGATVITSGSNCGTGTITTNGITSSQLIIGCAAVGTLEINANPNVTTVTVNTGLSTGVVAGFGAAGNGSILVNGDGSASSAILTTPKAIVVGVSGGTGSLTVMNGGKVETTSEGAFSGSEVQAGNTNSSGTILVDGANSLLSATGRVQIGAFSGSTGSLTVSGGATVQATGTIDSTAEIGTGQNATGTVTVTGPGSTWDTGGLIVGAGGSVDGFNNTATLLVENGGTVTTSPVNATMFGGGGLSVGASGSATVTVTGAGSSLVVTPLVAPNFLAGKEVLIGGFGNGAVVVENDALLDATGGNINVSGGFAGTSTADPGSLTVRSGGTVTADTITVFENGTLNGDGTIDANVMLSGGTIAPGNSPGIMTIIGDLILNSGILDLEIGDFLDVTGDVVLGTDLVIELTFDFDPMGDTFNLSSFFGFDGSLFSDFNPDNLMFSGLSNDAFFTVVDFGGQTLTFGTPGTPPSVPEPATLALFGIGLAGMGVLVRRRKRV